MQFSAAKKIKLVTIKTGGIKSVRKKLDIEALPSTPYMYQGLIPSPKPPEDVHLTLMRCLIQPSTR